MHRRERLDVLTALNVDELIRAFALPSNAVMRAGLWPPARGFARQLQHLDDLVGRDGLAAGARWALRTFTRHVTTIGREQVPATGPVLAVANHPGLTDVMALVLALHRRADLRIVALDRPVLHALPAIRAHLLEVPDGNRIDLIARARRHLRGGGALLTFPAGAIEPDPTVRPSTDGLPGWSRSVTALTRGLSDVLVLPMAVSGVISRTALATPLVRRLPDDESREFAAACLQVLVPRYRDTDTRVVVGAPFHPAADAPAVVRGRIEQLLREAVPAG